MKRKLLFIFTVFILVNFLFYRRAEAQSASVWFNPSPTNIIVNQNATLNIRGSSTDPMSAFEIVFSFENTFLDLVNGSVSLGGGVSNWSISSVNVVPSGSSTWITVTAYKTGTGTVLSGDLLVFTVSGKAVTGSVKNINFGQQTKFNPSSGGEILPTKTNGEYAVISVATPTPTTPQPTATRTPTPTVTRVPTPTVTRIPTPTSTRGPTPTGTRRPTPTGTVRLSPTVTRVPSPTVTRAPTVTGTLAPTATPASGRFSFYVKLPSVRTSYKLSDFFVNLNNVTISPSSRGVEFYEGAIDFNPFPDNITYSLSGYLKLTVPRAGDSGQTLIAGDVTGDNKVDETDVTRLFDSYDPVPTQLFLSCSGEETAKVCSRTKSSDFNFDGIVNALDYSLLVTHLGQSGSP